jgi:hypothetical protein
MSSLKTALMFIDLLGHVEVNGCKSEVLIMFQLTVQAVQGQEVAGRTEGCTKRGNQRWSHYSLPRPTDQGQRHSAHQYCYGKDRGFCQV